MSLQKETTTVRRIINVSPVVGVELTFRKSHGRHHHELRFFNENGEYVSCVSSVLGTHTEMKVSKDPKELEQFYGDADFGVYSHPERIGVWGKGVSKAVRIYYNNNRESNLELSAKIAGAVMARLKNVFCELDGYLKHWMEHNCLPDNYVEGDEAFGKHVYVKLISGKGCKFVRCVHTVFRDREADTVTIKGLSNSALRFTVSQLNKDTFNSIDEVPGVQILGEVLDALEAMVTTKQPEYSDFFLLDSCADYGNQNRIKDTAYISKFLGIGDSNLIKMNIDQSLAHCCTFWDNDNTVTSEIVNALSDIMDNHIELTQPAC